MSEPSLRTPGVIVYVEGTPSPEAIAEAITVLRRQAERRRQKERNAQEERQSA